MKLGVMADSHDNLDALEYWVDYFAQNDVDVLIHAGDLVSPFTVPVLGQFPGPVYAVFGNNDGDRETLKAKAEGLDVTFREPPTTLDLTECTLEVAHKPSVLSEEPREDLDLQVHGHTHERRWKGSDTVPVANPGESGGWLSGTSSALTVYTGGRELDYDFQLVPKP
jgi:putative phosphoesterase